MSAEHGHRPDGPPAPLLRPRLNRRRLAVGTAGLAVVLGTGAYITTSKIIDDSDHPPISAAQEAEPIAPLTARSAPPLAAGPSTSASIAPVPTADASGSPLPTKVVEEIKEARRKMAKDGVPVKPPVVPKVTTPVSDVKRTTKGSLQEGGILRTITARGDLTGQEELAYVAGGIRKYRNVSCTQTFQFSTNPSPGKRDNLLMCWRTSAEKSVIAMVVDPKGKPSPQKAHKAITDNWRRMD